MARQLKDYILISLKGVAMGASDTVPGVSGGTIAFISGIYEELINSLGEINFSLIKNWKKHGIGAVWKQVNGNFLLSVLIGIALSVFTIMRLTRFLLDEYPIQIWSFFFGLVLASIWFLGRQIKTWGAEIFFALILSAGLAYWITTFSATTTGISGDWFLIIAGAIAICAMILPGISGAFILVLLGVYKEVTTAVSEFDFKKILLFIIGAVTGLLLFSKILKWLFDKYEKITLAALTGFIAGSLNKVWPWKDVLDKKVIDGETYVLNEESVWPSHFNGDPELIYAILCFGLGFVLIFILEGLAHQISPSHDKDENI